MSNSQNTSESAQQEAQELKVLRDQIDSIDQQIHKLVNQRAECAQQVAHVKEKYAPLDENGNKQPVVFYRPEREAQVLRRVMERNEGPLTDEGTARLFREIMSQCLALEEPMQIAYLGPEGTFTQLAALKHFGQAVNCEGQSSIADVFREVESGSAHYGVVPVENSTEGVVTHTLDSFAGSHLKICGEVALRIHHHFLINEKTDPSQIKKVYSHAQSLAQCRSWLDSHYANVERIAVSSNAEAARRASKEEGSAAIASESAGNLYGLKIATANIEDMPDNTTRFLIIGQQETDASGDDKTSMLISSKNEAGALYHLLAPFHELNVSLTRIETRPAKTGTWNYMFFIDVEGHINDENVQQAIEKVKTQCADFKWLGSYPNAAL